MHSGRCPALTDYFFNCVSVLLRVEFLIFFFIGSWMGTGVTHTSFVNGLLPRWVFCRSIYFIFHFPACSFPFFWIAAIKADIRSPAADLPDLRQSQEAHSSSSLIFVICTASSQSPKATFPAAVHAARVYSGVLPQQHPKLWISVL